jgi:O-antigen ligase
LVDGLIILIVVVLILDTIILFFWWLGKKNKIPGDKKLDIVLLLLFFAFFFALLSPSFYLPRRTFVRWAFLIGITGVLLILRIKRPFRLSVNLASGSIWLFVGWCYISGALGVTPKESLARVTSFAILTFLSFHLLPSLFSGRRVLSSAVDSYFTIGILILLVSGAYFLSSPGSVFIGRRFSGILLNPNTFGSLAAGLIIISLSRLFSGGKRRFYYLALSVFLSYLLLISLSRASYFAATFGSFSLLWLLRRKSLLFYLTLAFVVFFSCYFIISGTLPPLNLDYYLRLSQADPTTGRLAIWVHIIEAWKERPWFGVGLGGTVPDEALTGGGRLGGFSAYLALLGETGIIGLVLFLIFLSISIYLLYSVRLRALVISDRNLMSYSSAAISLILAYAANSLFEGYFSSVGTPITVLVFILVGAGGRAFYELKVVAEEKGTYLEEDKKG